MQVKLHEAKARLSQLIKSVQAGEEVIIVDRGEPVARLVPMQRGAATATGGVGSAQAILGWIRSHPLPAYARRSAEEIDAAIREEKASCR
jgi:prevent-host-death family protein